MGSHHCLYPSRQCLLLDEQILNDFTPVISIANEEQRDVSSLNIFKVNLYHIKSSYDILIIIRNLWASSNRIKTAQHDFYPKHSTVKSMEDLYGICSHVDHLSMLNYMEFMESLKRNLHLFKQKFKNCIDIPSAQEKVKSVIMLFVCILPGSHA